MSGRLRVLYVTPNFYPAVRYGGPIQTVLRTCQELLRVGVDLHVATTDADGPGPLPVPLGREVDVEGVPVRYYARLGANAYAISLPLGGALFELVPRFDVVHVTGAFSFSSGVACAAARRARVPYVVSPRGSCRPYSLAQKRWKKAPYFALVERRNLARAHALHATSDAERDELAELVPGTPVWTIPNGIDLPPAGAEAPRRPRQVLFLGRLHPVKAVDRLVRAASLLQGELPDLEVVLAGPDDVGEWARLSALIGGLSPRPRVRYVGLVEGEAKRALLAGSGLLVLPSHGSENFGQVVLEALAHGTPVVASRHTPWRVLEERGAGAWVDNEPASLAAAIRGLVTDEAGRGDRAAAARALAETFGWEGVAARLVAGYEGIRASAPR